MRRRIFVAASAAGGCVLALPSLALAAVPTVKITRFRVGLASDKALPGTRDGPGFSSRTYGPSPCPGPDHENHYEAAVIQVGDRSGIGRRALRSRSLNINLLWRAAIRICTTLRWP